MKPRMTLMKILADQITLEKSRGEERKYRIVMVPRKVCSLYLNRIIRKGSSYQTRSAFASAQTDLAFHVHYSIQKSIFGYCIYVIYIVPRIC